jgi:hypothetical protein
LPFPALDLSFKQKHPANNALAPVSREFRGLPPKSLEPHDVGSEYAVYMVGSPAKSAFRAPQLAAGLAAQVLDVSRRFAYTSAVPERIRFQPPPRLTQAARCGR